MERLERALTLLNASATRYRLYGPSHRLTRTAIEDLHALLTELFDAEVRLRIGIGGEELFVNDHSLALGLGPAASLARRLTSRRIGLLEILPGVSVDELLELAAGLATEGEALTSRPHVRFGEVELALPAADDELDLLRVHSPRGQRVDSVRDEALALMELNQHIRQRREVRVRDLNEIVYSFIAQLGRQSNVFANLAEIRDHSLFTYLHTCNVASLSIGFGRVLQLEEKEVFDLGTAALLHDVGKQVIPVAILEKPDLLDDEEWAIVRRHPVEGARMLMAQKEVCHLAVVVAFEHHMHYDGQGGYPQVTPPRQPALHSQLISIADTFDALFGNRSYNRRYDVLSALEILNAESGRLYNPELVDLFTRYVNLSLESADLPAEETPPS